MSDHARRAAGHPALLVRPLRQAPRLEPPSPHRRGSRTLAPVEDRQGEAQARHRPDPRSAGSARGLPHRHRAGLRHRRGRDGAVVAARRRGPSPCWPGNPSAKAGSATCQKELKLKDVTVLKAAYGELPDLAKVDLDTDVVFTWNGTTSGVRVPNADWIKADRAGPDDLRRHLGRLRAAARLAEARCRDLLLAEGARRRGRARHDRAVAARGRAARELHAAWPLPKIFRMTKGGKLNEDIFEGETINTPSMLCVEDYLDTLNWAKSIGGLEGADRARRRQRQGDRRLGRAHAVDRVPRERSGDPLQHLGLPQGGRSGGAEACRPTRRRSSSRASPRRWRRKASPTTSTPIAMRRRACASGAARPSRRADVEALTQWLDWAYAEAKAALPKAA